MFIHIGEVTPAILSLKKFSTQRCCVPSSPVSSTSLRPADASSEKIESTVLVNSSSYSAYSFEICLSVFLAAETSSLRNLWSFSAMRLSVATRTRKNSSRLLE